MQDFLKSGNSSPLDFSVLYALGSCVDHGCDSTGFFYGWLRQSKFPGKPGIEEICFVVLGSRGKGIDVLGVHMGKMSHAGPFRGPRSGIRRVLAHPQEHELEI